MAGRKTHVRTIVLSAVSALALMLGAGVTSADEAETVNFDIEAQPLAQALLEFSRQSKINVIAPASLTRGIESAGVSGEMAPEDALEEILGSAALDFRERNGGGYVLVQASVQTDTIEQSTRRIAAAAELEVDEIVVTGSNIRGVSADSSPSLRFDREDLEQAGFATIEQFVETLPQNFGGGAATDTSEAVGTTRETGLNPAVGSGINLRGLGSTSTLVLLNGRRMAPSSFGFLVDTSLIPISAVESVEIVTDGASAIYGADAVAGVVNFTLREDFDGAETSFRYGTVTDGNLQEYQASQLLGTSWETGNALAVYEYYSTTGLQVDDRAYAQSGGLDPNLNLLPDVERHGFLISANQNIGSRLLLFADAIGNFRETENQSAAFISTPGNDVFNVAVGADIELFDNWVGVFSGSYGENTLDFFSVNLSTSAENEDKFENSIWAADAKVDGGLFALPGGEVKLAVGTHYRNEGYRQITTDIDANRDVFAAFGELFVPIVSDRNAATGVQRLEFSLAARFEDYSDFGSSTDPKIGLLWSPIRDLNLRGTYSTSFRAPTLFDRNTNTNSAAFLAQAPDPTEVTGGPSALALILILDNPDLDPEESENFTVGFDYTSSGMPGLSVSATYYDINYENRIAPPDPNAFVPLSQPDVFGPVLTFMPTAQQAQAAVDSVAQFFDFTFGASNIADAQVIVDNRVQNIAVTDTSGIEFDVRYSVDSDFGDWNLGIKGNYILTFEEAVTITAPRVDDVDTVGNPAALRLRANVGWSKDRLSMVTFVNHTGSYVDTTTAPEGTIDAWTTVDFQASYDTGARFRSDIFNDIRLAVSVQNLFDEDPPFFAGFGGGLNPVGYDAANASPLGRFIAFQVTKRW